MGAKHSRSFTHASLVVLGVAAPNTTTDVHPLNLDEVVSPAHHLFQETRLMVAPRSKSSISEVLALLDVGASLDYAPESDVDPDGWEFGGKLYASPLIAAPHRGDVSSRACSSIAGRGFAALVRLP